MSSLFHARVERVEWADIEIDVPTFLGYYAKEREEFEGTDEAFIRHSLDLIGARDLMEEAIPEEDGIRVLESNVDEEIT